MVPVKHSGKGRSSLYDSSSVPLRGRDLQLRERLRQAIATGAIQAHYQPIITLESGQVTAFEALARWEHDGQYISPDTFIPIASRAELLPALTEHMLEQACAQLATWSAQPGQHRLRVSVNVPPRCSATRPSPPPSPPTSTATHWRPTSSSWRSPRTPC